ncbi:MAG: DUF397 domain-containing protein [Sciscionella sp.]|nr:DUF397 domain-containing protein [Sciscionella sp.]
MTGKESAPIHDGKAHVRGHLDVSNARWKTAGDPNSPGGAVQFAFVTHTDGVTYTAMRNSAEPDGTVLVFTPTEWNAFVAGAKDGEFDEPW